MDIVLKSVSDLIPYENNPRVNDMAVDHVAYSISEFGFKVPIVIDKNNIIVTGHTRLKAAEKLGLKEVPCILANDLTPAQIKAFRIADNKTSDFADWNFEKLDMELSELKDMDFDYDFGFELEDFGLTAQKEGLTDPDEIPEEVEPICKEGDLWLLGEHRLLCGDATKKEDVERLMNGEKADMVFTDPPYGINIDGDNSKRGKETSLMKGGLKLKSFIDDSTEYATKAFSICSGMNIKTEIWWGANYYCHSLPETGNWLLWDKRVEEKMTNTNSDGEIAWVKDGHNSVRIFRHLWNGLIKASEHGQKRVHPTQKPIELAKWCFDKYNNPKSVLDLFLGSGSTLIACEKTNRKCYGMEIDPHYCDVIIKRWEDFTGEKAKKI